MKTKLLAAILCCGSAIVKAQDREPIVTDRPDQTEAPSLVPAGGLQIETGFVYEVDTQEGIRAKNITYNTTLVKYGVNENFEIRLVSEYLGTRAELNESTVAEVQGIGPLTLGVKIRLSDEKGIIPQAALIGHINLRTGSREYQPQRTSADFRFTCAHTLSEKFSLGYNVGAEWSGDGEFSGATFLYTASIGYTISERVGVFVESYAFFPEREKADHRFDGGLTYKFSPVVQWDLSAGIGLTDNAPDSFIGTGLSVRLFK